MVNLRPYLVTFILMMPLLSCEIPAEESPNPTPGLIDSEEISFQIDTLYTRLENPWAMAWLPDGRMLITERKGEILVFEQDEFIGERLEGLPEVFNVNQAGLLDLVTHPDITENGWLYIAYAKVVEGGGATAIMRFKLDGNTVANTEELIVTAPAHPGGRHYGSRIIFDNDRYLYFSNGDRGNNPQNAQELNNSHGKIHRIYDNGQIPEDNPFVNVPGAIPSIWTYGNRNPQGLVYDREHDRIWEIDHGPKGGDEINLIEKGNNYGWPVITHGIDYDGSIISDKTEKEGMEQPVHYWDPSIAPCGSMLVTSDQYPEWKGNLLIGALAGQHINRVELDGTSYVREERLLQGIGRVRDVAQSPDGFIYAITEGSGLLIKILPED